ncbi:MAG TPA: ImmA/IrrE family metallo-endopeptidase [Alloacidobacterium sp.]|nr:ImmA/IrrE family metallo-endopeptidase [Alloacidobacterium sp.]
MTTYRDAVLEGTLEAEQLHADIAAATGSVMGTGAIDVFNLIEERNILLVFQKLGGLLGAFLNLERPGILVTTERTLAIQRFTAAHELGHAVLKHSASVDDDSILSRSPFGRSHYDLKEMAADTFAAMFLMPETLINAIAEKQKWNEHSIRRPEVVYQMSLRLGVSYEALARTLVRHGILARNESVELLRSPVKSLKQRLLGDSVVPPNWYCNVWDLTENDMGSSLTAEPNDYFVVRLREMAGAGYLWNIDQAREAGFHIISDRRNLAYGIGIGSDVERVFTAQTKMSKSSVFTAIQVRPYDASDIAASLRVDVHVNKAEIGFTPRHRMEALAA